MSMRAYLGRIQHIYDQLRRSDHQISETMPISTIIVGLRTKYEHGVAIISASIQPYDLADVTSVLLDA